jgi:hypothetical protein
VSQDRACEAAEIAAGLPTVVVRFGKPDPPYRAGQMYRLRLGAAKKAVDAGLAELELIDEGAPIVVPPERGGIVRGPVVAHVGEAPPELVKPKRGRR